MKLSAELLGELDSALNPLKERELDLRGLKIAVIENLGATRDQNDCLDLTDNEIKFLGNFPRLSRLGALLLANNLVSRIDPRLYQQLPNLRSLVLSNNAVHEFRQVVPLRKMRRLEYLSLLGNPIAREKHYREFVLWRIPSVRVLDYQRVSEKERAYARTLFETPDGRPTELAVHMSGTSSAPHPSKAPSAAPGRLLTAEERASIADAIERSTSLEEVRRLEERLKLGYLPHA
ncbi:U2 snRNP complex subunit [Malassezia vespertilionis]|uniref:U2 small nuclear ribonucleoprotein A' n=1 Tax=Malassezia vespertilionis TaxID=2020962 RepID=A0A2N1J9A3_9BASI|nr:U2 snRNP complex subunit [Malassezia vespertilionis]PKI83052.1 Lea1p [Malassezia vespertilionis]WFD07773.1 U2 snRNP complex subunit [Malassezia vespertilionis]